MPTKELQKKLDKEKQKMAKTGLEFIFQCIRTVAKDRHVNVTLEFPKTGGQTYIIKITQRS